MPAVGSNVDTLSNWAKTRNPNESSAYIIELLNQSNEMISDIQWEQSNAPFSHRTSVQIALPTVGTRQLGQGIAMSTSREAQFDDGIAILDAFAESDIRLADASGDTAAYRLRRTRSFTEAMSQFFGQLFWYGDTTANPTQFFGMTPRYNALTGFANSQNVLSGGGSGSVNTSMWLLTHGEMSLTGIFPTGMSGGLQHTDWGKQISTVTAGYGSGTVLPVYKDQYTWLAGLSLKDWRQNVRIANIDTVNLTTEQGAADLFKLMTKAYYRLPQIATPASTSGNPLTSLAIPGRRVWYCNRTVREMLEIQADNKVSNQLRWEDLDGRKQLMFKDAPIHNSDQILNTEATVV
jgi:hypothetical protein